MRPVLASNSQRFRAGDPARCERRDNTVNNESIGIGSVFVLTLFLFLLRHFYLSIGRREKSRQVTPTTLGRNQKLNKRAAEDDAWLLWTPDPDPPTDSSKRVGDR
jgi:hypothetical protein